MKRIFLLALGWFCVGAAFVGIFLPGIPIGKAIIKKDKIEVELYSQLNEITFVNVNLEGFEDTR